jgi:hypothetical protein
LDCLEQISGKSSTCINFSYNIFYTKVVSTNIMSLKYLILGTVMSLMTLVPSLSAQAQTKAQNIELKVYTENQDKKSCPNKFTAKEQAQPYREGGFATDGSANLSAIATNISITASNNYSVTWVGTLKPNYAKCLASAGISAVDGTKYEGNSRLRMHFVKGKVYFMLDLAGESDPNNYPLIVLKKGLKNGNPIWTWGGSD